MNLEIQNYETCLEVTIHGMTFYGEFDQRLLLSSMRSHGLIVRQAQELIELTLLNSAQDWQRSRLFQTMMRYDVPYGDVMRIVPEVLNYGKGFAEFRRSMDVRVRYNPPIESMEITSLRLLGNFDEDLFHDAFYWCGVKLVDRQVDWVVEIGSELSDWQKKRTVELLGRYGLNAEAITSIRGLQ